MKKSAIVIITIVGSLFFFILLVGIFGFLSFGTLGGSMSSDIAMKSGVEMEYQQNMPTDSANRQISENEHTSESGTQGPRGMHFVDYGTHVFVNPESRPYSTFALDVDTASYTIAKNYIMNGNLPPKEAIRPEEFINYFDYDYPDTEKNLDIYTSLADSPFDDEVSYMRVALKAQEPEVERPKKITLVIDVSGSMSSGNRLGVLKKSLSYLINNLDEDDYITIITYNSNARVFMETEKVSNKNYILSKINSLSPGGSTNAEAGLKLGYSKADQNFNSEYVNRVILLSDGVANVGTTDPDGILAQLKDYREKGITLTSIGVGMGNYNDELLEQIADKADGNYFYINELDEGKRVFDKQLQATMEIAAIDVKMQLNFIPEVVDSYRLIGYENRALSRADFENESADAGEIGAGHEATALYQLKLNKDTGKICDLTLRYKVDGESQEEKTSVYAEASSFDSADDDFKLAIAVSRYAQILKLTAPPPEISQVKEILDELSYDDLSFIDFKDVIYNAEVLINNKR